MKKLILKSQSFLKETLKTRNGKIFGVASLIVIVFGLILVDSQVGKNQSFRPFASGTCACLDKAWDKSGSFTTPNGAKYVGTKGDACAGGAGYCWSFTKVADAPTSSPTPTATPTPADCSSVKNTCGYTIDQYGVSSPTSCSASQSVCQLSGGVTSGYVCYHIAPNVTSAGCVAATATPTPGSCTDYLNQQTKQNSCISGTIPSSGGGYGCGTNYPNLYTCSGSQQYWCCAAGVSAPGSNGTPAATSTPTATATPAPSSCFGVSGRQCEFVGNICPNGNGDLGQLDCGLNQKCCITSSSAPTSTPAPSCPGHCDWKANVPPYNNANACGDFSGTSPVDDHGFCETANPNYVCCN